MLVLFYSSIPCASNALSILLEEVPHLEGCEDHMCFADKPHHHTTLLYCFLSIFDLKDSPLRRAAFVS